MVDRDEFDKTVSVIRARVGGVTAIAVLGADGVEVLTTLDPGFDSGLLAEFAMLVRIAERASVDASAGSLDAMTWKTENAVVLMHRVSPDRLILLFGSRDLQASRARYQLSRAASGLSSTGSSSQASV